MDGIVPSLETTTVSTVWDIISGGDISKNEYIAYIILALLGFFSSVVLDIYSSGTDIKGFSIKKWWDDNRMRLLISILLIFIGLLFSEELLGVQLGKFTSFMAGFSTDKVLENLKQRKRNLTRQDEAAASSEVSNDSQ